MDDETAQVIHQLHLSNREFANTISGLDLFIRTLASVLHSEKPEIMDSIAKKISAIEIPPLSNPTQAEAKRYALIIARNL